MNKFLLLIVLIGVCDLVNSAAVDPEEDLHSTDTDVSNPEEPEPEDHDVDWGDWNEPEEEDELIEMDNTRSRMCGSKKCKRGESCANRCRSRCVKSGANDECPDRPNMNMNKGLGESCNDPCNCLPELTCVDSTCQMKTQGVSVSTPIGTAKPDMDNAGGHYGGAVAGGIAGAVDVIKPGMS